MNRFLKMFISWWHHSKEKQDHVKSRFSMKTGIFNFLLKRKKVRFIFISAIINHAIFKMRFSSLYRTHSRKSPYTYYISAFRAVDWQ